MTQLPSITQKQHEVVKLLFRYRFLDRFQIQAFLNHKDKRRIISWLKDLREKQYLDWRYDPTGFIAKSRPAIYYLSLNGIRYLRQSGEYPAEELRKRYKEPSRTQAYIDRCLLLANCSLALKAKSSGQLQYTWALPADYANPNSAYHFLNELKPQLYFTRRQGDAQTNYILESFEATLPRYQFRKRLKELVDYLTEDWDVNSGPTPVGLFVCASTNDLIYAKRRSKQHLEEIGEDRPDIRVTTLDKLQPSGVTGMIWEDV